MKLQKKAVCDECGHICEVDEILVAKNPFDDSEDINGCPNCHCVDSMLSVCDYPGCSKRVSCGTSTMLGYRLTCGAHRPEK